MNGNVTLTTSAEKIRGITRDLKGIDKPGILLGVTKTSN